MTSVVGLVRVSTSSQAADGKSGPERQRHAIEAAASRYGLTVVEVVETIVDGSLVGEDAAWRRVKEMITSGRADGLVVDSIDRLSRSTGFDLAVLQDLLGMQARLFTPDGEQSITAPTGQLFTGLRALFAGYEKAEIKRRMMSGADARRRKGHWTGRPDKVPYGTRYDKSTGWSYVEPDISEVVEQFREFAAGVMSMRAIGRKWGVSQPTLSKRLRNTIYNGRLTHDRRVTLDRRTGKQRFTTREDAIEAPLAGLKGGPAVDDRLWAAVQARLLDNDKVQSGHRDLAESRTPLLGILYCARCGEPLQTQWSDQRPYYRCRGAAQGRKRCDGGQVRVEHLHQIVPHRFVTPFGSPDFFTAILARAAEARQTADTAVERARLNSTLKALRERKARLVEALVAGVFSLDEISAKKSEIEVKLRETEARLATIDDDATRDAIQFLTAKAKALTAYMIPVIDAVGDMFGKRVDAVEVARAITPTLKALGVKVMVDRGPGRRGELTVPAIELDPTRVARFIDRDCKTDNHTLPCIS